MIWIQVIVFVISNAPTLIKAIRELMKLFRKDKEVAKAMLGELKAAKKNPRVSSAGVMGEYQQIIDRYKDKVK